MATEFQESPISIHCVHLGCINTNIASGLEEVAVHTKKTLVTHPNKMTKHIIKSIQKNNVKIV